MEGTTDTAKGECQGGGVFLLCATNCPWDLDSAFLRRFQKRLYVPLPDFAARKQLLKRALCKNKKRSIFERQ